MESDAGEPASPKAPAVPTMHTMANGLKPSCTHSGTKIAARIGTVENDEPMPMVTNNPTSSINNAPTPRLWPMNAAEACTSEFTSPVALSTSAKPEDAIMMKPIIAIIFMPSVNRSSVSRQRTMPDTEKIRNPARAPMIIESSHNWMMNAEAIARPATSRVSGLYCTATCSTRSIFFRSYTRFLR